MSSNLVEIVYIDVEMTWDFKCVIFAEDYVELEISPHGWNLSGGHIIAGVRRLGQ